MAAVSPTNTLLDDFTASIPEPGRTPVEHLAHTAACLAHVSDAHVLLGAGDAAFRAGHLRTLAADRSDRSALHALLLVLVANRDKAADEVAITATAGVYGPGRTGLTWGDLLELAL